MPNNALMQLTQVISPRIQGNAALTRYSTVTETMAVVSLRRSAVSTSSSFACSYVQQKPQSKGSNLIMPSPASEMAQQCANSLPVKMRPHHQPFRRGGLNITYHVRVSS